MNDLLMSIVGNSFLGAVLAFALVLIPSVIIHELGHFIAGKLVGITILEFGVGFPPRIARLFVWRGTEFTLNALPLGGFVRPLGEDFVRQKGHEEETEDRQEAKKRGISRLVSVNEAKPLARIFFFVAGAIANLLTAFILFVAIGMMGIVDITGATLTVVEVQNESALYELLEPGDTIEAINGQTISLDQIDDASPTVFESIGNEAVTLTVLKGATEELVEVEVPTREQRVTNKGPVRVMGVAENTPADDAGILAGDLILQMNGVSVTDVVQLQELTALRLGLDTEIIVQRDGMERSVTLTPRENPPTGEGAIGIVIQNTFVESSLGLIFQMGVKQELVNLGIIDSIMFSIDRFASLFRSIIALPSQLFSGQIRPADARPVSVVGISQVGREFLERSIEQEEPVIILNYIALISVALGLTNLLPLPALDGGRILFVLIELVRGRPLPPEREGIVHLLGLILLLSLTVVVVFNDIRNPITNLLP